jgi:hypothetical protein
MRRFLLRPLLILLALLFLFEAWLWEKLAPVVAWVVGLIPLARLKARFATSIERLPPYPTLLVFLVPVVLLLPLKFLGLWLLAKGAWFGALSVLAFAKMLSVGVTAFIFSVTRAKLMQLGWFRWIYETVMQGLAWAHALADPIKATIKLWLRDQRASIKRWAMSLFWSVGPTRAGRFLRRIRRIRRRFQAAP